MTLDFGFKNYDLVIKRPGKTKGGALTLTITREALGWVSSFQNFSYLTAHLGSFFFMIFFILRPSFSQKIDFFPFFF